jgi:thymidylate kinase
MARTLVRGRLVIVEGPDGVGKTTVCRDLTDVLTKRGVDVLQLSFPGKQPGTVGELVYRVHHDEAPVKIERISELAKQALHVAAHIDAIDRQIQPALEQGKFVLLDRFWWSAWVYGLVGGCKRYKLRALVEAERKAWGSVRPALAILLQRPTPIDRDISLLEWRALAQEYDRLSDRERRVYPVIAVNNVEKPDDTVRIITEALEERRVIPAEEDVSVSQSTTPNRRAATVHISHILPIKPSMVYDTYWRFAAERQNIFFRRLEGLKAPWTDDPILAEYKFTNAYRASDRVSQYLIHRVIYRKDLPATANEVFFRIMLFKLFNKIATWETLEAAFGSITFEDYTFERYDRVLSREMAAGTRIYSAAYIMPSGGRSLGHDRKHRNHLVLLERMLADSLPKKIADSRGMQEAFELLKSYPSIGDFLAYQYVTDLNYSELTDFRESSFVVPGPGALDGIRKCFLDTGGLNEPEIIKFMADRQEREFERLGLTFRSLWGRRLMLIDCQNLFCEVDKYSRVRHPEVIGISGRSRIKQRLDPEASLPAPWYPPKWELNPLIKKWRQTLPELSAQNLYADLKVK